MKIKTRLLLEKTLDHIFFDFILVFSRNEILYMKLSNQLLHFLSLKPLTNNLARLHKTCWEINKVIQAYVFNKSICTGVKRV